MANNKCNDCAYIRKYGCLHTEKEKACLDGSNNIKQVAIPDVSKQFVELDKAIDTILSVLENNSAIDIDPQIEFKQYAIDRAKEFKKTITTAYYDFVQSID
jgi:hypothetical protein